MFDGLLSIESWGAAALTLFQVVMIDLVLAGDNAVAIGMAASGLERKQRRQVIALGLAAAVAMRIGLALVATVLLGLVGLLLAGGALLLWVCWKLAQELRHMKARQADEAERPPARAVSFRGAFVKILIADLSMSLDNVLGVAGAAHDRPIMLAFGLLLSIGLTGVAASWIAEAMNRRPWIGYLGLVMMTYVAAGMIWQGHRDLVIDLKQTPAYNAALPGGAFDIGAEEMGRRADHKGRP